MTEANAETLMRQASTTAGYWMARAVADIDDQFGEGYAGRHPELVAAYMHAAAIDQATMHFVQVMGRMGSR